MKESLNKKRNGSQYKNIQDMILLSIEGIKRIIMPGAKWIIRN
jgi:hypothetical protein